jgi:hypothetical protein
MNEVLLNGLNQSGLIVLELAWDLDCLVGQLAYQKLFRRRMELNMNYCSG